MPESLRDLMIDALRDLYHAEHQLVRLLPQMSRAASAAALRQAFDRHLGQTVNQALRLDRIILRRLGCDPRGRRCRGMEGLVAEAREVLEQRASAGAMDAALVAVGQRIEHYEIAAYGSALRYALLLGRIDVAEFLQQSLEEEAGMEELLADLAEHGIDAAAGTEDEERAERVS